VRVKAPPIYATSLKAVSKALNRRESWSLINCLSYGCRATERLLDSNVLLVLAECTH
jgi:hypothetical protein